MLCTILFSAAGLVSSAYAQDTSDNGTSASSNASLPSTYPHDYPGKPSGDFSPEWQDYFFVREALPNVSFPLPRSFAGNIGVNRAGHPNDTLFFWAFENQNGSLTAAPGERSDAPWAIWLNGGPDASSMLGLLEELGPLQITENGFRANELSWVKFADYIFVDQPVGTGFSTADSAGYVTNEDQMGEDFLGFLRNLVKVFPSLATRPFFLTGESYAGHFIPYITKALFSAEDPPVKLSRVAIGNGGIGTVDQFESTTALALVETYPQLVGYDTDVYEYFREQTHLCGFDFNLTYPQTGGKFPSIYFNFSTGVPIGINTSDASLTYGAEKGFDGFTSYRTSLRRRFVQESSMLRRVHADAGSHPDEKRAAPGDSLSDSIGKISPRMLRDRENRHADRAEILWIKREGRWQGDKKRDLSGRANGTIDPWYACYLTNEVRGYALNFSSPWSDAAQTPGNGSPLDVYNIPDARKPKFRSTSAEATFLNHDVTRAALHAPRSKQWSWYVKYPFNNTLDFSPEVLQQNAFGDPSLPPSTFFDELLANTSTANIPIILYSGNDDSVVHHFATDVVIQNTTFGGIQGFSKRPSTPFLDDDGTRLGIVHQERGLKYLIIEHAGHEVPKLAPRAAYVLFRDFVLGSKDTGTVQPDGSVVGGEDESVFVGDTYAIPGQKGILYGNSTSTALYMAPEEKIDGWNAYLAKKKQGAGPA